MSWERCRLDKVAKFINGKAYKSAELLQSGKYRVLRVGNLFTNNSWYYSDLELDENKYCSSGDLIYAWSATFGPRIWKEEKVIYHYHIWKILPDKRVINKIFLFYVLDWDTENIKATFGTGATMIHITKSGIESRKIPLPPLQTQKRIADILSAYDDLIENNLKRIKLLEQAAQNIYKEWFVNMRFPGYEEAKFDSETGLPAGWEPISSFDLFDINGGTQPPKSQWAEELKDGYTRMIQIRDYYTDTHIAYVKDTAKLRKCKTTDIMIARYGASVGRICWGLEGAYNVALVKVLPKDEDYTEFIRWYLKSNSFQQSLLAMTQRAAQDGFNKDTFKSISAILPDKDIVLRFKSLALPILYKLELLNLQNHKLKEARDILLPRLMNQTIEV